jgi:hypothetical protein
MPLTLPSVTFDPTKTVIPRKTYVVFTPVVAGVAGSAVELIGKMAGYGSTIESTKRLIPDAAGLLRPDRDVATKHAEEFKFELEDVTLLTSVFGGLNGGLVSGFARFIVVDPDDASGTAAVASNTFDCTVKLDGGLDFNAGEVAKATLLFRALSKIILTHDAAA